MDGTPADLHLLRSAVADLEAARGFYERLLGRAPVCESPSAAVYHDPELELVVILEQQAGADTAARREVVLHVPSRAHLAAIAARTAQAVLPPDDSGTATVGLVPEPLRLAGPGRVSWTVAADGP